MKPWKTIDRAQAPGGGELVLQERDGTFAIRVGGVELMSSRTHGSEEQMAHLALAEVARRKQAPRVLVGGLGMGFTLRAVLGLLSPKGRVVVAELSKSVVEWNRGPLAHLADRPLDDPRVSVEERDVVEVLRIAAGGERFDAILLDVDNGPVALTTAANAKLYDGRGVALCREALMPYGALVVWSAGPEHRYLERLKKAGLRAESRDVTKHGRRHTLFVATRGR